MTGSMRRQMHLNAFVQHNGHHEAAWRMAESDAFASHDVRHFQAVAQLAEQALMDSVFLADFPGLMMDSGNRPSEMLDPMMTLAAVASVTDRIGLIATASTTFEHPYSLARRFNALDHMSGGRAGWNVVTTHSPIAAANFGSTALPDPAARYQRADEFLEVCVKLWDSWGPKALVGDKGTGIYADVTQINDIEHQGEHFSVKGALNSPRSPQGRPLIVQAGSSGPGIALAGKWAEVVFTAQSELAAAQDYYRQVKNAALQAGRDPLGVVVMPGLMPILGSTEEEAQREKGRLDELTRVDGAALQLAEGFGLSLDGLDLDGTLPEQFAPVPGAPTRAHSLIALARRDSLTVRQLLLHMSGGRGHNTVVGTPEKMADLMEEWFVEGAADGFNIMAPTLPLGLKVFVDQVIPILQKRGLFRTSYVASTLRGNLDLPAPQPSLIS